MGKLLKTYDITLSLQIEIHDIDESDVRTDDWNASEEERKRYIQFQASSNRALLHTLLDRLDYTEVILPALIVNLTDVGLQPALAKALSVAPEEFDQLTDETITLVPGSEGERLRDIQNDDLVGENVTTYLNAFSLQLRKIDIQEQ